MNSVSPNSEDQVRRALKALADHDRTRESSISAEAIFAHCRAPRSHKQLWFGSIGLAAAASLIFFLRPEPAPPVAQPSEQQEQQIVETQPVTPAFIPVDETTSAPPVKKRVRRKARPAVVAEAPPAEREVATDFFTLVDAPIERGRVMRVVVPAYTMRRVGLPVRPERWGDPVQADVLVGEEGMAHAIRFVSYQQ
jgi:hypothetical protein